MTFYTSVEKRGNGIFLRYTDPATGTRKKTEIEYKPSLYVQGVDNPVAKDFWGRDLEKVDFETIRDMTDFIEKYRGIQGYRIYGQRDPIFQFITKYYPGDIKFDGSKIHGNITDIEVFSGDIKVLEDGTLEVIDGPFPKPEEALYPISMLTIHHSVTDTYHVWGLETFKGIKVGTYKHNPEHKRVGKLNIVYKGFDDEKEMLADMVMWWQAQDFEYASGWYFEEFDVPYLVNRVKNILGQSMVSRFSPWGIVKERTIKATFGDLQTYNFMGTSILDMLNLFKKHAFMSPPDWKLNTLAQLVLGEEKISYEEEGNLNRLYALNYQKSVEYNIQDVGLVKRLDDKMQFFGLTFQMAYMTKSNFNDTLATVRPWSALAYSKLNEKGIQPELRGVSQVVKDIVGGFVKEVIAGKYRWVVSGDLNSLYPHLMQQYNLGVDTILEPHEVPQEVQDAIPMNFTIDDLVEKRIDLSILAKHNITMTANRQFFRKDRMAIFNELTRGIYDGRAAVKKDMKKDEQELVNLLEYLKKQDPAAAEHPDIMRLEMSIATKNNTQQAFKILMNGLYGAMANKYFLEYFDIRIAEGITTSGQLSIKWISRKCNEYFNRLLKTDGVDYVVANDTDSMYLTLAPLIDKLFPGHTKADFQRIADFIDQLFKTKIEPFIDESYAELATYMNAHDQRMFMKRETIASAAIWVAKKRYVMHAIDVEGVRYPKPKVKFTGVEAKRSSFPKRCRDWMVECYEIALAGTEKQLQERVKQIKTEYMQLAIPAIAEVTGVNGIDEKSDPMTVFIKGTPRHVKAALYHNRFVEEKKLMRVKPIKSGDKMMLVPLKKGAPMGAEVIGFQGDLPQDFGLHAFVDYQATYEKTFRDPMMNVPQVLGWSAEPRASVMDFFA